MLIIVRHLILIIKNFLVVGERSTDGFNDSTGAAEKKFSISFSKEKTKFCLSLHYNCDKSYLYVHKIEICKFKTIDSKIWCISYLERVPKDFAKDEHSEISLNGTVCCFSVDHSSIEKERHS